MRLLFALMEMFGLHGFYRDPQAGDDAAGGDAGAAGGDQSGATGDAGAAAAAAGSGGGQAAAALSIPDKFLVKGEGDAVNHEATLQKVLASYGGLEKRFSAVGDTPAAATDYQLQPFLPEGYESKPEGMAPVLDAFHKLHMTNAQVQGVMNLFGQTLGQGMLAEKAAMEQGRALLKEAWGDNYDKNMNLANSAVAAFASPEERQAIAADPKLMANPVFIGLMAKIGADLHQEDTLPNDANGAGSESLESLRSNPAYADSKHPDHKAIVAQVNALYKQGAKLIPRK
ncbi:MAG TPA: hypothetical protein VI298_08665 [Geobacteraceae bacterium]